MTTYSLWSLVAFLLAASAAAAQLPAALQSTSDCPASMMPSPQPQSSAIGGAMLDPKAAVVNAAKKRIVGSKSTGVAKESATSRPALPKCLTPEGYAAAMQAQQSAAMKGAATAMLTATPVGMAVVGANAAAPVAGKVAGALSARIRRGRSRDNMMKELAAGRLLVEEIRFAAGAEAPSEASGKATAVLVDALKSTEGRFVLRVTPESDGAASPDAKLAHRRAGQLAAALVAAGVPASKIVRAPITNTVSWESGPPRKSAAHVELVLLPPTSKP